MNPKITVINGKTYNSVDEMRSDIREKYEQAIRALGDANNNHIPDAFENRNILADKNQNGVPDLVEHLVAGQATVRSMKINHRGWKGIRWCPRLAAGSSRKI